MKILWNMNQISFAAIGGFIGWFLGGCDGLLYALLVFIIIDYITGVMCAIENTFAGEAGKSIDRIQITVK